MKGFYRVLWRHTQVLRRADGQLSPFTVVLHLGVPAAAGASVAIWTLDLSNDAAIAVLTAAGLFAAFSFGLSIQLLATAANLDEARPERSPRLSKRADLNEMIAGSAAYLSLVSMITAAAALAVTMSTSGWNERTLSAVATALVVHLGITASALVAKVFSLTAAHLRSLRSGGPNSRAA